MKTELIYQDETSNKFWTIVVEYNKHTVTYGRVGSAGTSKTKTFKDVATAEKDATKLINAKKKKGYVETASKAAVVRDAHTFVGKPVKVFGSTINPKTAVKVLSEYDEKVNVVGKLDKLGKLSNIAEMDTLIIGAWQEAHEEMLPPILAKLIELKATFSGLKHLFIGDMTFEECEMSWIIQADYSDFYQHFPALETFGVRGGDSLKLGKIKLPNLKNLIVETGGMNAQIVRDILASDLQGLVHLELWLGTDEYGCSTGIEDVEQVLNRDYPNLKYLGLKNYDQQDDVASSLRGASIIPQLDTLDLSMGTLSDKGAKSLFFNDALLELNHINCRHHYMTGDWQNKLSEKFAAQNINLDDAEVADEDEDGEQYFYVEIGE